MYLSQIAAHGYATKDIRARIALSKTLFMDKEKVLTGKVNCEQKKRIIKCTVWNVPLYAAETWTLIKASNK